MSHNADKILQSVGYTGFSQVTDKQSVYRISPLLYLQGGEDARAREEIPATLETEDDVYLSFLSFLDVAESHTYKDVSYNKQGADVSRITSSPLLLDNFRLFLKITSKQWEEIKARPELSQICMLVEEAMNAQLTEGAVIGSYIAKMVALIQGRTENVNHSGTVQIEPITGIQVL